jgi:phage terminase small subunit
MSSKKEPTARKSKAKPRTKARKRAAETVDQIFESLPPRQQRFVLEYLANGFNGTKAAIAAGYAKANADTQASRLLANPRIAAVIAERTRKVTAKLELTAEWVLSELHKLAAFDVRKLYRPDGSPIPITELDDVTAASIAGLEVIEQSSGRGKKKSVVLLKKWKLADKGQNLERLGRHFKLFTDRVEHGADKDFMVTIKSILSGGK